MNAARIKKALAFTVYTGIEIIILLLQASGIMTLNIATASLVTAVPFTVYAGFCFGEFAGAGFGFIVGAVLDTYSSAVCFNVFALTVIGFLAGLFASRLFNRNFSAAAVLSTVACVGYFFAKWLILYAFTDPAAGYVLSKYVLPSFVYTAAVSLVLYVFARKIVAKLPETSKK